MVILAGGLGKCLLGILKVDQNRPVVSMALGLGCLSLVFLMIAWIFGISVWWGWGILVALFIGLFRNIHAWVLEMVHMNKDIWHRSEPLGKIIAGLCSLILLATLIIALAPPVKFDALVYHLALPRNYIEAQRIIYLPENSFWGMPQVGEMLYTWVMLLGGTNAAACLGWLTGFMTLVGLLQFVAKKFDPLMGWIAVAALLSGYTLAASLSWAYIDWFTMLFGLSVLIGLDQWMEKPNTQTVILMGVLAGFCLGSKYTAGVIVIATIMVMIWRFYWGKKSREEIKYNFSTLVVEVIEFGLSVFVITLPWWIKNYLSTGNPFYPVLMTGGTMDAFRLSFYQLPNSKPIWHTLLLPFMATFMGVEGGVGYSASIGPLLLGLALFAWLPQSERSASQKRTTLMVTFFVLSALLIWMVASRFSEYLTQSRLYFALFPALAVLSAIGFNGFSQWQLSGIRFRFVVGSLVIMCLGFSALEVSRDAIKMGTLDVLFNIETEEEYLGKNLGWYYPAVSDVATFGNDHKVLMLFEPRSYFCIPYCDPDEILDRWKHDLYLYDDTHAILQSWRDQGYTHLLFNRFGMEYIKDTDSRYLPTDWEKLETTLSKLTVQKDYGGAYIIYSLTP